jgi:hypothetical protein
MRASLIVSPHLMQGISTLDSKRVHVGVGRSGRSIVSRYFQKELVFCREATQRNRLKQPNRINYV